MATALKEARKLTFIEIVMNADAEVIQAAYKARVEVDKLLALRQEAYRQIAELETKVEDLVGQPGLFVFPPPPLPVAGMEVSTPRPRKVPRTPGASAARPADTEANESPAVSDAAPDTPVDPVPASDHEKTPPAKPEAPERPSGRPSSAAPRSH